MTTIRIKHPIVRTSIAIALGFLVLMISASLLMVISKSTSLFEFLPMVEKPFTHIGMFVFSVLFILILNKGKLKDYGFTWNLNFPLGKIVLIGLSFGFLSVIIGSLFSTTTVSLPTDDFTLLETILFIWVWASICEEVLSRGLIQGFLTPLKHIGLTLFSYRISLPVIVGALFFGAMHLALLGFGVDVSIVLTIVVFGILLGVIAGYHKEKTNSLVPAIIVHFCFNVGGFLSSMIAIL